MRYKVPDKENSFSIFFAAKREMDFTLTLPVSNESGPTIVRNIYEAFRMLGDSILVAKGIKSESHIEQIDELIKLNVNTLRPIRIVENLRKLRHNINYYGYSPKVDEVEDIVDFAKKCFAIIAKEVKRIITDL